MKKFSSIEDYIEVINGDRDPLTGRIHGIFDSTPPIISLARYDVQILSSMSQTTQSGRALTDRQAELAVKLILKYRRQLEKNLIDVSPVESPTFRLGIRQIDRRRLLYIEDDSIVLKFPYDTTLINDLRDLAKISQGRWKFNSNNRSWTLALTETNVVAANGFAQNHQFEIAPEFADYINAVVACEQQSYEIKLIERSGKYEITNAAPLLNEAIENLCGFNFDKLDLLVDAAPVYGYTVDEQLVLKIADKYGPRIANLMTSYESKFAPTSNETVFKDVLMYAEIVGRYPIYVYEPDMSDKLYTNFVERYFAANDIIKVQRLNPTKSIEGKKVIYFNKYTAQWNQPVPLLISSQGMMFGGEKSLLSQSAKKIIYFATEVYKKT